MPSIPITDFGDFGDLGDERYVELTTYRRSGVGVPTPVWVARDGDALVVTTVFASGKVKRLLADPRVSMRPCGRMGDVAADAPTAVGVAEVIVEPERRGALTAAIRAKYDPEYSMIVGREGLATRRERAILRITSTATA